MKKLMAAAATVLLGAGAFAAETRTVQYGYGSGSYWSSAIWATERGGAKGKWKSDSIDVAVSGNFCRPQTTDAVVCGIVWESSGTFLNAGVGRILLGAGGLELVSNMGFKWTAGNAFHLTDSQTWRSSSDTAKSVNMFASDNYSAEGTPLVISAADDVELTLGQKLTWNMKGQIAFDNADLTVGSSGKLAVSYVAQCDPKVKVRTLTVDGSTTSTIALPSGEERLQIGTLKLRNGGKLSVSHSTTSLGYAVDEIAEKIVADTGAGTLAGKLSGGTAAVEIEVDEDATLTLAPTWAGDPAEIALTGAGTVVFGGSGVAPVITSVEGFTGTIEMAGPCAFADGILESLQGKVVVSANATLQVDYPKAIDASKFEIVSGKTLTLRYVTARPPVTYADGLTMLTGISQESDTNGWSFVHWNPATAKAYGAQETLYSIGDGKLSCRPKAERMLLIGNTSETAFSWDNKVWQNESGVNQYWVDGATAKLQTGKNTTCSSDVAAYGLTWGSFSSFLSSSWRPFYLGAGGVSFTSGSDIRIWNFSDFRLTESQTWTGPSGSVCFGDWRSDYKTYRPKLVSADEDVVLTLSGGFSFDLNCPADFSAADILLAGTASACPKVIIDRSKWGLDSVVLNARTLTLNGSSRLTSNSDARVDDGYTVAKKVVFGDGANGSPELAFDAAIGGYAGFDVGAVEVTGEGTTATISGTTHFCRETTVPVTIGDGCTLVCSAAFTDAADHPGALTLAGEGAFKVSGTSRSTALVFTPASVSGFAGEVRVAAGAVLNVSGAVDFPSLVFEGNATIVLNLARGDGIVDWRKVTFPESGKITIQLCRGDDDPIAAGEGSLDTGLDLSAVSEENRAKIALAVLTPRPSASYKVTATPRFDEDGRLYADLGASITAKNNTNGTCVWLGRDWGDATDLTQWGYCAQNSEANTFDSSKHPDSLETLDGWMSGGGIYGSMNWRLDLKGRTTWYDYDSRANSDNSNWHYYGITNGTLQMRTFMIGKGYFDIKTGATLKVPSSPHWSYGNSSTLSDPSVFRIHGGGTMTIGSSSTVECNLYNVLYQVDEGGHLAFRPSSTPLINKARTTIANSGETAFPRGFTPTHGAVAAITGGVDIVQSAGTLRLAGAFTLPDHGTVTADSSATLTLAGGTTVLSNGVSFSDWDLAVAEGADFAIEIPKGGDFSMADFAWGANAALEKSGAGILRLAAADNVDSAAITLGEGAVAGDCAVGGLVFAGGAVGADPEAVGGLTVTNGTVSGTCRVRQLVKGSAAVPFLTVAAENDPGYTSEDVVFENAKGKAILGKITKESVTVGDVECVRYSAEFIPNGLLLLVR